MSEDNDALLERLRELEDTVETLAYWLFPTAFGEQDVTAIRKRIRESREKYEQGSEV